MKASEEQLTSLRDEFEVKPADRVLFAKWSGTEVRIDGEDLLIMKQSDVVGVLEESIARRKAA